MGDPRFPFTLIVTTRPSGITHTAPFLSFVAIGTSTKGHHTLTTEGKFGDKSENLDPAQIKSLHIEVAASRTEVDESGVDPAVLTGAQDARGKDAPR